MTGDYFLNIDGIEGESHDAEHKGEIELDSWSFGGVNSGGSLVGGGARVGKFTAQALQVTMKVSKASPRMFQACATGEYFRTAILVGRKGSEKPLEYVTITFSDVLILSYQQSGSRGGDSVPTEQASINFAKIEIEYREQNPDGTLGEPVRGGVDLKSGQRI